jgi:hypothetical protein
VVLSVIEIKDKITVNDDYERINQLIYHRYYLR